MHFASENNEISNYNLRESIVRVKAFSKNQSCNQGTTDYPSIEKPWLTYYDEEAISRLEIPDSSIYEYLRESCRGHLDDVAIDYLGTKISFKKLLEEIARAAESFKKLGVMPGDVVAVALPNLPQNVYAIYALSSIGAIPDLIDLRSKGEDLALFLNATHANVAVVCDLFLENMIDILPKTSLKTLIVASPYDSLSTFLKVVMKAKRGRIPRTDAALVLKWDAFVKGKFDEALADSAISRDTPPLGGDAACVFHTSGTTGAPKGVVLPNRSFNVMVEQYRVCGLGFEKGDSFLNQVPPFLAYNTILALHLPLSLGMKVIMLPAYEPEKFASILQKHRPNHIVAGPQCWRNVLEDKGVLTDASFLKTLASGGDSMRVEEKRAVDKHLKDLGCGFRIVEGYGMTEVGSAATTNLPQTNVYGSMGIPLPMTSVCIYDNEASSTKSVGEEGEVCISGPTVMMGYFANEAETNAVLKRHSDGTSWIHTGDLGYLDEEGRLYLSGRLKRMIISHEDMKIPPFPIEKSILEESEVVDCCVVGAPDVEHGHGQVPYAFVELAHELSEAELNTLRGRLVAKLPHGQCPVGFEAVEGLPVTPNGKVDYRRLEQMASERISCEQ